MHIGGWPRLVVSCKRSLSLGAKLKLLYKEYTPKMPNTDTNRANMRSPTNVIKQHENSGKFSMQEKNVCTSICLIWIIRFWSWVCANTTVLLTWLGTLNSQSHANLNSLYNKQNKHSVDSHYQRSKREHSLFSQISSNSENNPVHVIILHWRKHFIF